MRYRLLALAALALIVAPAAADEKSDAVKAVIEKAVKAHGGAEALGKFKMTRTVAKGTLHTMGTELEFSLVGVAELPDKIRNEIKVTVMGQTFDVIEVFDGKKAWVKAMGNLMELDGEQLEQKKESAFHNYLESILPLANDKSLQVTAIGDEKINDKAAVGIKVTKKDMKEYRMYFDKESGLLVKTAHRGKDMGGADVDTEGFYHNYKDIQGVKTAMKLEVKQDGKKFLEAEVSEVKLGEKADEGTFKEP